ncbi:MAG: PHP domain-containing protein [Oscillospiraceae bacterium]|nr:PHP domain-containing protein [Oscillospiraceae bacterium]
MPENTSEYRAEFVCDLHTHTKRSDGNDTCRELVDFAAAAGIEILALTDHDIIAPETIDVDGVETSLVDYAKTKNVSLLPGIEFSCDTQVEDVHIVALGCDYSDPFFEREYQNSIRSKIDGYHELCDLLTEDGLVVDWYKDILLDGQRDESAVQRKQIFETLAQKGYVEEWSDGKLLVKNTPKYNVKRKKPDPVEIIENIHGAGGIAILAHPYLISEEAVLDGKPASRALYIDNLIAAGLDGIEVSYPYGKTSYGGTLPIEEIEAEVRERYSERVAILSGGSDYHNEGKKGSKNPRLLGEKGVLKEYFFGNELLSRLI